MPDVRLLMWNIKFFSGSVISDQTRLDKILDTVQPAGAAPSFDIFIIVEPNKFSAPVAVGEVPAAGSSPTALRTLLFAFQGRDAAWRLVPPRALTTSTNKEIHGVFYYSTNVTLVGPDNIPMPAMWGGVNANAGRVRQSPNNLPANGANEVVFNTAGQRRPYLVRFSAGGNAFDVYSHHAAPDADYPANATGIRNFADVYEIGAGRARPVLITGDFNCCPMAAPCVNGAHHGAEVTAQNQLTGAGAVDYEHGTAAMATLRAVLRALDLAQTALAAPTAANTQAIAPEVTNAVNAATVISNKLGILLNATLAGLINTATQAATDAAGAILANAAARAAAAQQAVLALAADVGASYGATTIVQQLAIAIAQTDAAKEALRAGNNVNASTAVNAVGAAGTAAANAAYGALSPTHAALVNAANLSTGTSQHTANLGTLAVNARDALVALAGAQYRTHVHQTLTSLKTRANAFPTDYRNHAFDHIVTHGFVSERDAACVDLVAQDPSYNAGAATNTFRALFGRYFKGPGSGKAGISDHLPVKITVRI